MPQEYPKISTNTTFHASFYVDSNLRKRWQKLAYSILYQRILLLNRHTIRRDQKSQAFRAAKKVGSAGLEIDTISFYDVDKGVLARRPAGKAYGEMNLYQNVGDPTNVNYIEEKFSKLEGKAAHLINQIHDARPKNKITITRHQVETLRKFTFLMHYRKATNVASYFSQDHPENTPLAAWIRNFKEKNGFKHDFDVWLFGMRYYLDTPHHAIISTAEELKKKYGDVKLAEMMIRTQLDADFENWHAIEYESISNGYFLGICEAADGEEFVLGSNGFGLWEGTLMGEPGVHRLYVISPQVAIILRDVFLLAPELRAMVKSSLSDIALEKARTQYATSENFSSAKDEKGFQDNATALAAYRATPKAQSDLFTFKITKLTPPQTHNINEVIMLNINPNGSLTFCSPLSALSTVRAFMASKDRFVQQRKKDYSALLKELTSNSPPTANAAPLQDLEDNKFKLVLDSIVNGAMEFKSEYDRAHHVFSLLKDDSPLSHPIAVKIRKLTGTIVELWTGILGAPPKNHNRRPEANLVETLSKEDSDKFYSLMKYFLSKLGVEVQDGTVLMTLVEETIILCVVQRMARNRHEALEILLGDVQVITV